MPTLALSLGWQSGFVLAAVMAFVILAVALAAYRERSKWCAVKGCDKPAAIGWMGCCSEQCMNAWLKEVERRSEVKEARKLGIPVAVYRQQLRIRGEI